MEQLKKMRLDYLFIAVMSVLAVLFLVSFIHNPQGSQVRTVNVFYGDENRFFCDFADHNLIAADKNIYFQDEYPGNPPNFLPFVYVLHSVFARAADYAGQGIGARFTSMGLITENLFYIFWLALLFIIAFDLKQGSKSLKYLVSALLFLSYISLFSYGIGNWAIVSCVLSLFFLFSYNSGNKIIKELALIAVAVAAVIKIYPFFFAVVLLYDKKYIEFLRVCVYGAILAIAPYFFFVTPQHSFMDNIFNVFLFVIRRNDD